MRKWTPLLLGTAALAAACTDFGSNPRSLFSTAALQAALQTTPLGYGEVTSSYNGNAADAAPGGPVWLGGGRDAAFDRGELMGGGLGERFAGGVAFGAAGPGRGGRGPFGGGLPCGGTFDASTGRVSCTAETRGGLTINRSAQYKTASGTVQSAFDSLTTDEVNLRETVTGSLSFTAPSDSASRGPGGPGGRHGWGEGRGPGGMLLGDTARILNATTTVNNASDRTVKGLASGSTSRTLNSKSTGSESTTGTSSRGTFTATRTIADTTTNLVMPVPSGNSATYPTSGKVVRVMNASVTFAGASPVTLSRREVVTYDGSATATVVITENGTTKNCTRPLPRGRLSCS